MTILYSQNPIIAELISHADSYQKSTQTGLRLPKESEIGMPIITHVQDGNTTRVESMSYIKKDSIIARNLEPIGNSIPPIFNEWPISKSVAIKNYGIIAINSLNSNSFSPHKKIATLKGIVLTQNIMNILSVSGDILNINVEWSNLPMQAKIGDLLTDAGYSISQHDMKDYEKIS